MGETLEECCAREVFEEAGVKVDPGSVRFVASQPWPFPQSLMAGFTATAISTSNEELPKVHVDTSELEDARWFARSFVAARLDGGSSALDFKPSAAEAEFHVPGSASLARVLISRWAQKKKKADLEGESGCW